MKTCAAFFTLLGAVAFSGDVSPADRQKGKQLYVMNCAMCHQAGGQGVQGVIPPLGQSEFVRDKERAIRAVIGGLSGELTVRGQKYNGVMPPSALDDAQLAQVLTYVSNSFGNSFGAVRTEEVKTIRAQAGLATSAAIVEANPYPALPVPPEGFTLREVARLSGNPVRIISDGTGKSLYVLFIDGDVKRVDIVTGAVSEFIPKDRYLEGGGEAAQVLGVVMDNSHRLYLASNQKNTATKPVMDDVTIYRTEPIRDGENARPRPWLKTSYPWGIGGFNHCVNHLAFGPDGLLYVNSGSRTDGNEPGRDPNYSTAGEVELTACLWRVDPASDHPRIEVFARGLRNAFGFCWNDQGELFATDNGPDADAPEELNLIEQAHHYGFPFQFSNWSEKPYTYTPDGPTGVNFTFPIANLGPAAKPGNEPAYTFDPHSSPAELVFLDNHFPPAYRGTFLVARFGNLLRRPRDVGFDLLQMRLKKNGQGVYEATTTTLLAPLARPISLHHLGPGRIYIAEYSRNTSNSGPQLPGRILELAVEPAVDRSP